MNERKIIHSLWENGKMTPVAFFVLDPFDGVLIKAEKAPQAL